jgi:glycosyltransferase involved in cell wall biosynthesis
MIGRIRTALLGWSDAITAFTPESLEELRGIGYPAGRVLQAPNGVSLATMGSPVRRCASEAVTVVYVGRLLSEKGVEDLLRAWLEVSIHARRPVLLRLVGTGPKDEDLRRLVSTLRLRDSVEFVGYIDDVTGQLSSADIFVLPSYGEGNSNAILEAMRAGLPIVATRVGGTPYQVGAAGQRYLVEPGDTLSMSERLLALIHDDAARLGVGSEMRARVERLFGIDRVAQSYERAYRLIRAGRREELGRLENYLSS